MNYDWHNKEVAELAKELQELDEKKLKCVEVAAQIVIGKRLTEIVDEMSAIPTNLSDIYDTLKYMGQSSDGINTLLESMFISVEKISDNME